MAENQQKDILKWIIGGLFAVMVAILILAIGIKIGERRAKFSYRWAKDYHRMFAGPPGGFFW